MLAILREVATDREIQIGDKIMERGDSFLTATIIHPPFPLGFVLEGNHVKKILPVGVGLSRDLRIMVGEFVLLPSENIQTQSNTPEFHAFITYGACWQSVACVMMGCACGRGNGSLMQMPLHAPLDNTSQTSTNGYHS